MNPIQRAFLETPIGFIEIRCSGKGIRSIYFIDFRVSVDGRRIIPDIETRSFSAEGEITSRLRSLGLPLSVLDRTVTPAVQSLNVRDRLKLESDGLIDCSLTKDERCWPYWKSRTQFYWRQRFAAGRAVVIRHTYRPVVGGGYLTRDDDGAWSIRPFCGGADTLRQIGQLKTQHPVADSADTVLVERRLQYILTTANNWGGAIRRFRLSVETDAADDLFVSCMPGMTRTGPTHYELIRSNFHPDADLDVLIMQPRRPDQSRSR